MSNVWVFPPEVNWQADFIKHIVIENIRLRDENARLKMIVGVEETSMRPRPKFHLGDRVIHQGEQWRIWCVSEFPGKEITYRLYKHDPRWAYVFKPGRNVPESELIADREVQYELF